MYADSLIAGGVTVRSFRFPILLGSLAHGTNTDGDTTGRFMIGIAITCPIIRFSEEIH